MMNVKFRSVILGAVIVTASVPWRAEAQTRPGFEVGAQAFDYRYRERFDGDTVARDDGTFIGINAAYVETIGGSNFLRATVQSAAGSVDYSSSDGSISNVSQAAAEIEFHLGRDLQVGRGTLTIFGGLGGRALTDESGGKQSESGAFGYDREVAYTYLPIGLAARLPTSGRSSLKASAQYNYVLAGETKSRLSGIDPELPDLTLKLKQGHGFHGSIALAYRIGRREFSIGPFFRHWKIERSESYMVEDLEEGLQVEFFEPRNTTTELGLKVALSF